jgi:hypothetical protein
MNDTLQFDTIEQIINDRSLADDDLVTHPDEPGWQKTVGELRLAARQAEGSYAPPNPFEPHLAKLRAAECATDERSKQEADYRALREREFAGEAARLAALRAARGIAEPRLVTLSDAERRVYTPPDPYKAGIEKLRAKEKL